MASKKCRLLWLFTLCFIGASAVAQRYKVTDLGQLSPTGINSWAQVVGNSNDHAFIWDRWNGMRDLGTLSGGTFSSAASINDLAAVVGSADGPGIGPFSNQITNLIQPFLWTQKNGMQGLGGLAYIGFLYIVPFVGTDINDRGHVVGYTGDEGTIQYALSWTKAGGLIAFGFNWPPTRANAISNRGQIVGQNPRDNECIGHAALWKNVTAFDLSQAVDLGTLGSAVAPGIDFSSSANDVNDSGQIVGWSTTQAISDYPEMSSYVHAVMWGNNGAIQDLGTLAGDSSSAATKVNLLGQVIGSSGNDLYSTYGCWADPGPAQVSGRPFIWSSRSGMRDLNTLIPANSGWVLNSATDINVWGQIVGSGTRNGRPHGYLLTPLNPFHMF
jgi:probable HAF family extracellular repeat protein